MLEKETPRSVVKVDMGIKKANWEAKSLYRLVRICK